MSNSLHATNGDIDVTAAELARRLLALEGDANFQRLLRAQARTNIFRIVGTTDRERWHSAFWAWVFDPAGSHGLGDLALKRLLAMTCEQGSATLRAQRLRAVSSDDSLDSWAPDTGVGALTLNDLFHFRVDESIVAPGPSSSFQEVTAANAPGENASSSKSKGDDKRFDVLVAARCRTQRVNAEQTFVVLLVVEMKVGAAYDAQQLQRYSKWLHQAPSPAAIGSPRQSGFRSRLAEIFLDGANGSCAPVHSFGVFVSRTRPWASPGIPDPESLAFPWTSVEFSPLIDEILEPALHDPRLDPSARPLIEAYVDLVAHPDMEVAAMPPSEHRKLVLSLLNEHLETFRIIQRVLETQPSEEHQELGASLAAATDDAGRQQSLQPQFLIDLGFAAIGNRLQHAAPNAFTKPLVAELVSGKRNGFHLVDGPQGLPIDPQKVYSATGLLREAYASVGKTFYDSGNRGWRFIDGSSKGKTLEDAYGDARVKQSESNS